MKRTEKIEIRVSAEEKTALFVRTNFEATAEAPEQKLRIRICSQESEDCNAVAEAALDLDARYPSVWQTKSVNNEAIFITVQALKS